MNNKMHSVIAGIFGALIGGTTVWYLKNSSGSKKSEMELKMTKYYATLNNWLEAKLDNKNLSIYFKNMGYETIAIYGMKEVGERLYKELKDSEIVVKYAIDKNAESIYADVDMYTLDDELPKVDVIVVTPTYYYNNILRELQPKVECPIVSLDVVIDNVKDWN